MFRCSHCSLSYCFILDVFTSYVSKQCIFIVVNRSALIKSFLFKIVFVDPSSGQPKKPSSPPSNSHYPCSYRMYKMAIPNWYTFPNERSFSIDLPNTLISHCLYSCLSLFLLCRYISCIHLCVSFISKHCVYILCDMKQICKNWIYCFCDNNNSSWSLQTKYSILFLQMHL